MADLLMPRLSDGMEEGTILRWLKETGDDISVGDDLVEIETDKANVVYAAEAAGTLTDLLAGEGDTLPVGAAIARIAKTPAACVTAVLPQPVAMSERRDARVKISPVGRRLARAHGIDLAAVRGRARNGRILKADVLAAIHAATTPAPTPESPPSAAARPTTANAKGARETRPLSRLQQTVARRMAESMATVPHFYLEAEIDMTHCVAARRRLADTASDGEVVPSFNDMVVKASALALRAMPKANSSYADGELTLFERINVGVAVAGDDQLVVPTVFDADRKGLAQIASETRLLAARVRAGTITPAELAGGTFTVSNLGMHGVSRMYPVVNPPQAAILGVGRIDERPIAQDGELVLAPMMSVVLAADHRVVYGADGARLLGLIKAAMEEPLRLAL